LREIEKYKQSCETIIYSTTHQKIFFLSKNQKAVKEKKRVEKDRGRIKHNLFNNASKNFFLSKNQKNWEKRALENIKIF